MNGNTKEGNFKITLQLTRDQVEQLTRLVDMAKMINGRDFNTQKRPETFDVIAYRMFLQEILQILYKSLEKASLSQLT